MHQDRLSLKTDAFCFKQHQSLEYVELGSLRSQLSERDVKGTFTKLRTDIQ